MIIELSSPLPLVTPKGKGYAYFLIDYGMEHDLQWICFINETGECWTFSNKDIRLQTNITLNRLIKIEEKNE